MMLVVKNLKMNLNQSGYRDNLVECQYRDQKLLRLFQPWPVLRGFQDVSYQMLEQL